MKGKWSVVRMILILFFSAVIVFSGYQIISQTRQYRQEEVLHEEILQFQPPAEQSDQDSGNGEEGPDEPYIRPSVAPDQTPVKKDNPTIKEAIEAYSDAVGWIKIKNTNINYLFAQGEDNSFYVDHNIKGQPAGAGTIFLDSRCEEDLSSYNSILYGHHMRNGSMFAHIDKFKKKEFFDQNPYGKLYLADATYHIDFFAVCVVDHDDEWIYRVNIADEDKQAHLAYIKEKARHYRELDLSPDDRLITLSTCNYEFENARGVLIGRLVEVID